MAPFRGNRGGHRGRGGSRGGRGARGGSAGSGKIARSGIRTRAGYRKFDSQRVKEIGEDDASDEALKDQEEGLQDESDSGDDEEDEEDVEVTAPAGRAYSALLQSFQQQVEQDGRSRKRRKIERSEQVPDIPEVIEENGHDDVGLEALAEDDDQLEETGSAEGGADEAEAEDETEATSDPFEAHFASPDDDELSRRLESVQSSEWRVEKQPLEGIGVLHISTPDAGHGNAVRKPVTKGPGDLILKQRLAVSAQKRLSSFDDIQQAVSPYIFNYTDLLLSNRTPSNASTLRELACLHAINHVLKGRDKVLKNNARLAQSDQDLDLRDQGFTRPKVLILLETRQMCVRYAETIIDLFEPEQQENKQRFKGSFEAPIEDRDTMPEDYRELFDGNNDNNFLTALKFTRKTLKFYSAFYTSDIILASPLGLRRILENDDVKKRDHDFLSSIEVAIVDQADAMQMQNWENVEVVFKHLNLQLKEAHGCDFSRVRPWYLDGNAKYLRQTIVFSAYTTPEINRLFNTSMLNVAGKAKLTPTYTTGAITSASSMGIKQTFSRFDSTSPATDPDARFKYFTTAILPSLLRLPKPADGAQGILVFIPSYYDFLRLRNFFATSNLTSNISFGTIHDYSSIPSQRRARSHFLSGRHSVLLYTQRAHHFFRLPIRGVKRVVCYGLPDNHIFYEEVVGGYLGTSLEEGKVVGSEVGARSLFSKWDGLRLERVVGSERVKGMLGGKGDTFDFV